MVQKWVNIHKIFVELRLLSEIEDEDDENGNVLDPISVLEYFYHVVLVNNDNKDDVDENSPGCSRILSWFAQLLDQEVYINDRTSHINLK